MAFKSDECLVPFGLEHQPGCALMIADAITYPYSDGIQPQASSGADLAEKALDLVMTNLADPKFQCFYLDSHPDATVIGIILDLAHTTPYCEVKGFYVATEQRGKGLGRRLLAAAMRETKARGAEILCAWVNRENDTSRATFDALGFESDEGVYDHRPDCVYFQYALKNLGEA